jgi:AcrR family transcriptional regulator
MKGLRYNENLGMTESLFALEGGRTNQKLRTRAALIAAARDLIAKGGSPSVEDAAAAATISRTTAYRYFKNQAELLAAAHPETTRTTLLPKSPPAEASARLEIVVRELTRIVLDTEPQQRTMLRLSLDPARPPGGLPLRQGRAIAWIEEALEPLQGQLTKAELRRLVLAIRASAGIEALVWLTDVAGLSRKEAVKNMRWSAQALLVAAVGRKSRGKISPGGFGVRP